MTDDKKKAVEVFGKYDRTALPVVDTHGRLAGIVTLDDVLDVAEEEATREIQRFGGLEALDEPYMSTSLPAMVRKRATWLVILFVGEMLTATAMGFFEKQIERAVVLALFVPLIISSGGNSGSQAATLIIRALAPRRSQAQRLVARDAPRDPRGALARVRSSARSASCRIAAWNAVSNIYGPHWVLVGLTVSLSLIGVVLWGTLTGLDAPLLAETTGIRPGHLVGPVRRNAGRRHRPDHLFHRRHRAAHRHAPLKPATANVVLVTQLARVLTAALRSPATSATNG